MKVYGKISETLVMEKEVEVEVADDADDEQIEQAIRDAAYEETICYSGGWEGVDTTDVTINWHRVR